MKKLILEKKEIYHIDYNDLQEFIREHYNRPDFNIICDMEWNNDASYVLQVCKDELEKCDKEEIESWKLDSYDSYHYIVPTLLNDLCNKGLVEEGEIYVSVCW